MIEGHVHPLAVGIEYFHTASLLFDDLPCMDDATHRRGIVCVHRSHGEPAAVLAALGLINRAYALLWRAFASAPEQRRGIAADYMEKCLGVEGILNGQSLDLHYLSLPPRGCSPQRVAMGKTVSLIRLALVLPALLGGASSAEVSLLERLAAFWGLSYQILDDLKDVLPSRTEASKTAARDASLSRPNLALAIGAKAAVLRLQRFMRQSDITIARLIALLPSLSFLNEPSLRFREELGQLSASFTQS